MPGVMVCRVIKPNFNFYGSGSVAVSPSLIGSNTAILESHKKHRNHVLWGVCNAQQRRLHRNFGSLCTIHRLNSPLQNWLTFPEGLFCEAVDQTIFCSVFFSRIVPSSLGFTAITKHWCLGPLKGQRH